MLKNGAQWCTRQKNYKIEKHVIESSFEFNIGSIEPNYAYILFKKKKIFLIKKKNLKNNENSKKKKGSNFFLK